MQELDDYLNRIQTLPPAPRILPELLALLQQEDVDNARIVELISFDPGLTASVLRVSNSAFFGGAVPVDSLAEAVGRLGFGQIYKLVLAASSARLLNASQKGYGLNQGELWQHSVTAAVAAQVIARSQDASENLAFTATLLHDIGKLVLTAALEDRYDRLVAESQAQQAALLEIEKNLLGVQHAEIGGRLLTRWNFPDSITMAVWHHHEPAAAGNNQQLAAYVYLGNMIAHFMGHGYGHQAFALRGRTEALEILGLKPEVLPQLMIQTFDKLQMVETLVSLKA